MSALCHYSTCSHHFASSDSTSLRDKLCARIMMKSGMLIVFVLALVLALPSLSSCARNAELGGGFRHILSSEKPVTKTLVLDTTNSCGTKFSKMSYTSVTSVCNSKVPATKACCAAFNTLACQSRDQVNNFNTICPLDFISYLNLAGGYTDGYFVGTCIDGTKGLCV